MRTTLLFRLALAVLAAGTAPLPGHQQAAREVTYERIRRAAAEPANWLTYSGNYQGHRHSPLTEIDRNTVPRLRPVWVYQTREPGAIETTPIVVDGLLYVTEHPHIISALDGRTGRPVWNYRRPAAKGVVGCCGPVNRGAAVLGDTLYSSTYDGRLLALDMRTGALRWEVTVVDPSTGHTLTAAPLAVKDKIIVGISGGEFGIRGYLDAYDAATGKRAWRLWTVPGPGEPGHETWEGESWKTGGAATWLTGSFDPELNLLYWGTGNPAPDYNGDDREGDNLYSNSLLAIDVDTGTRKWHFQFTPHDLHDWDSNQVPILVNGTVNGRHRKVVVQANRNGFYYVLDRESGAFLSGTQFARQTWAVGLDANGRPIRQPGQAPSVEGTLVYPGLAGATNWFSPSYSPETGFFYLQAREDYAQTFYKAVTPYEPGKHFEGGNARDVPGSEHRGVVKAIDALTGEIKWEFDLYAPAFSGVLSTAGGLVFGGTREGNFFALDAATGKPLWHFQTGAPIAADPISFAIDGRQHVAIAAGQAIFVFAIEPLPARTPSSAP
jgi:alcohol dehydrogenase (cytochrome c)